MLRKKKARLTDRDYQRRRENAQRLPLSLRQTCASKKQYKTRQMAKVARNLVKKYKGSRQRVYRCPVCRFYHLTSQLSWDPEKRKVSKVQEVQEAVSCSVVITQGVAGNIVGGLQIIFGGQLKGFVLDFHMCAYDGDTLPTFEITYPDPDDESIEDGEVQDRIWEMIAGPHPANTRILLKTVNGEIREWVREELEG